MSAFGDLVRGGFWRRIGAMIRKEFVQLRRDRITFATIVTIPLMQLVLFGYAINTQPRGLPTAVLLQESSDVGRSILKSLENTKYFKITRQVRDESESRPHCNYLNIPMFLSSVMRLISSMGMVSRCRCCPRLPSNRAR